MCLWVDQGGKRRNSSAIASIDNADQGKNARMLADQGVLRQALNLVSHWWSGAFCVMRMVVTVVSLPPCPGPVRTAIEPVSEFAIWQIRMCFWVDQGGKRRNSSAIASIDNADQGKNARML